MFGTREQRVQIAGLLVLAAAVFVARLVRDHQGAGNAMKAITTGCEFARPGAYRPGPFAASVRWCNGTAEMQGLMNHMRVNCRGMDACVAAEFGSMVAVGYLPSLDMFLVNMEVAPPEEGGEMITCHLESGAEENYPSPAVVSFLDENLSKRTRSFFHRGACIAHAMAAAIAGDA